LNIEKSSYKLYAITQRIKGRDIAREVEKAILGGATIIQLREKNISQLKYIDIAKQVKLVTGKYGIPLIINDDIDVMKASGADGVHLGQSDLVDDVCQIVGFDKIIGITAKTIDQALKAEKIGADYLGSGAAFRTKTKVDAVPLDHNLLQQICEGVSIPVVAIGGIDRHNIEKLRGRKISGVAVVSGIFGTDDVKAEAELLRQIVEETIL